MDPQASKVRWSTEVLDLFQDPYPNHCDIGMICKIQTQKFRSSSDNPIANARRTCKNQSQLLLYVKDHIHNISL